MGLYAHGTGAGAGVLVVKDRELGTNDCRGWIRRSLFERMDAPAMCRLLQTTVRDVLGRAAAQKSLAAGTRYSTGT
jgi:hypothetical protein